MQLPLLLQQAIETEISGLNFKKLQTARKELSQRYRTPKSVTQAYISSHEQRSSYLLTRLPATYAAVSHVLDKLSMQNRAQIETVLDLGAGPGTVMWAVGDLLPSVNKMIQIEQDAELIRMGQKLASYSNLETVQRAIWMQHDLKHLKEAKLTPQDLVIFSYSIGELPSPIIPEVLATAWSYTSQYLIVIEPGTPVGFERIKQMRQQLLSLGGFLVAPCPHANACPMGTGDWCHFAARVSRTSMHRHLKGGALGHEDEKFSYLIFSKTITPMVDTRVLRHPLKRSGHVILSLCTPDGFIQETVSKKTPERYKAARDASWGDSLSSTT